MLRVGILEAVFMLVRRTNPLRINRLLGEARRSDVEITSVELETAYLCGVEPEAILDAAIAASRKGLEPNVEGLIEAAGAGLDLHAFVASGYADPELRTRSALRRAAKGEPTAAARLATVLITEAHQIQEVIMAGPPQRWGGKIGWEAFRTRLASQRAGNLAEARELMHRMSPADAERIERELATVV